MSTAVQAETRDEAVELAETVASEIDSAIQHDLADNSGPVREFFTVYAGSLAGQNSRQLDDLVYDFHGAVTFLKATGLMRKYRMHFVVARGEYTGEVDLELRGTGIEG